MVVVAKKLLCVIAISKNKFKLSKLIFYFIDKVSFVYKSIIYLSQIFDIVQLLALP